MKFVESMKKEFTTKAWVLIPIAVGFNVVGGFINTALKLPLFLDSIGTILTGVLVGPWVGVLTGLLTNILTAIVINPINLPYAIVNMFIGLMAGMFAKRGFFLTIPKMLVAAIVISFLGSLSAAPITAYLFGGVTGGSKDVITAFALATGQNMLTAAFTGDAIVGIADKTVSCLIVYLIIKGLPKRYVDDLRGYEIR